MVQSITRCLATSKLPILIIMLAGSARSLPANIFDDAVRGLKKAGNAIKDTAEKAGKDIKKVAVQTGNEIKKTGEKVGDAIADRFKDTQLTRAIDYGARKAALETALASATAVLKASQLAADTTLVASEQAALGALTAGEKFLSEVVGKASPAVLQASAQSAQGILEGAKVSTIATLQGTRWVVDHTMTQFTITHIRYEGSLRGLEHGILGQVQCEGFFFGKKINIRINLDPRDIGSIIKSLEPLLEETKNIFTHSVRKPVQEAATKLEEANKNAEPLIAASAAPPKSADTITSVERTVKQANDQLQQAEAAAATALNQATTQLQNAHQNLINTVQRAANTSDAKSISARQELVRQKRANTP